MIIYMECTLEILPKSELKRIEKLNPIQKRAGVVHYLKVTD